jgi:hypothetical protein
MEWVGGGEGGGGWSKVGGMTYSVL